MSDKKTNSKKKGAEQVSVDVEQPKTKAELKDLLMNVRDKMTEHVAAPIYAVTILNNVMNNPNIYDLLDKGNKELARDIWLRIKQSGFQVKNPPLLFEAEEEELATVVV